MRDGLLYIAETVSKVSTKTNHMFWSERVIFFSGFVFYFTVQFLIVAYTAFARTAPVETDDAYTYILKAAQLENCFFQDCPAFNALRKQLSEPSLDPEITWIRYREYPRVFYVYHPLHSFILFGLHLTGISMETAFNIIAITGGLGLVFVISYWLYGHFGLGPTGIALFLLGSTVFPSQGLNYIIPSNLALGISILVLALLPKSRFGSHWVLLFGTFALVTMHPIGRLYALLVIVYYYFLNFLKMTRKSWVISVFSFLLVVSAFILPTVISRPELSFSPEPFPENWQIWDGLYDNLVYTGIFTNTWFDSFGGAVPTFLLIAFGIFTSYTAHNRSNILITLILLLGLLYGSIFHILPRYPAETFGRVWIPFAIFMTGVIAHGIWYWLKTILNWISPNFISGWRSLRNKVRLHLHEMLLFIITIVFLIFLILVIYTRIVEGPKNIISTISIMIRTQNSRLAITQPQKLLDNGCSDVLYMAEVPMHYYLVHGALSCGAVYYPALAGTPLEREWVFDNPDLNFLVTWNPSIYATIMGGGNPMTLREGDLIEINFPEYWVPKPIYIYMENPGKSANLELFQSTNIRGQRNKREVIELINLPAGSSDWQIIDVNYPDYQSKLSLKAIGVSSPIVLRGLRTDPNLEFNWPWDEGMTLFYQPVNPVISSRIISFETMDLFPLAIFSMKIIDDHGDTVLVKLDR
jgi:hypothetical protein